MAVASYTGTHLISHRAFMAAMIRDGVHRARNMSECDLVGLRV